MSTIARTTLAKRKFFWLEINLMMAFVAMTSRRENVPPLFLGVIVRRVRRKRTESIEISASRDSSILILLSMISTILRWTMMHRFINTKRKIQRPIDVTGLG